MLRATRFAAGCMIALVTMVGRADAGFVYNGDFEDGRTGWLTYNNAVSVEIVSSTYASEPASGLQQILIRGTGAFASTLDTFLGLTVGSLNALYSTNTNHGYAIKQKITAVAGETLSFDWNFLTSEGTPSAWNDFAFWSLSGGKGATSLADTGSIFRPSPTTSWNEETGLHTTTYEFTTGGDFLLGFGVMNAGGDTTPSALLVDNIHFASVTSVPEPGTLVLCGIGGIGMAVGAIRRRRKNVDG